MARYVKISTIGAINPHVEENCGIQEASDQVIKYWHLQFENVLSESPDLIVLPETSSKPDGFSLEQQREFYRVNGEVVLDFFREIAKKNSCNIAYSTLRMIQDGSFRNSTYMINRLGEIIGIYDKNHPTIYEMEDYGILSGKKAPIFECDFGKVACLICFDLNFEKLRQNYKEGTPNLLIFSSMYHGGFMQKYWAYFCRSYLVSAIAGLPSSIISPVGEIISSSTNYFNFTTATINLDYRVAHLDYNWNRLKEMKLKYGEKIKIIDPGYLGAVLISSETTEFSISEIIAEFKIELLDDYMSRSLSYQNNH